MKIKVEYPDRDIEETFKFLWRHWRIRLKKLYYPT